MRTCNGENFEGYATSDDLGITLTHSFTLVTNRDANLRLLREAFEAGLLAVSADVCLPPWLPAAVPGRTLILGIGKGGAGMAKVAAQHMAGRIEGIVLTRYGHSYPQEQIPAGVNVFEAGHPLPDERGFAAAEHILRAVQALGPDDQLLALISGGGSALLALPAPGVTLLDKKRLTRELLLCGATISEINCVRKHLSAIKGGRLALAAYPAKVVTMAVSDVPGDDPAQIASGPTVPDLTTLADARKILQRYGIDTPPSVRTALECPENETPSASAQGLARATTHVVARSHDALQAGGELVHAAGYTPVYLGSDIEGDAAEIGAAHAALATHYAAQGGRWALLSGGETSVVVRNREGRGGRNTEYLLSLALSLHAAPGVYALSCDTDGIDGTQDNAGAVIDPTTLERAQALHLSAAQSLKNNLSYDFFASLGDLIHTGPTRTNVNDFRIILIDR